MSEFVGSDATSTYLVSLWVEKLFGSAYGNFQGLNRFKKAPETEDMLAFVVMIVNRESCECNVWRLICAELTLGKPPKFGQQ
jgi:hypothetical protein